MITTALGWAIPMSALFCMILWQNGGLSIGTALGVVIIGVALGFAFASALCGYMQRKYRIFMDD
jgi:hypothetical protein